MSTFAKRERLLLADLLETAGPDAPTLCEGWQTRDLAAHVVVRERRPDAVGGLLIKQLTPRLERVTQEFAAKPYEELIQLIRTGPPRFSPFQLKPIDEVSNTIEFYVHTEDVRRAQPEWTPRELDPVFQDALWSRLERSARLMGRGAPVVTVTGEPSELLLFSYGRRSAAKVELDGDDDAIARLREAKQLEI
jgi:uncharacterized protein (TIGR03085 family)